MLGRWESLFWQSGLVLKVSAENHRWAGGSIDLPRVKDQGEKKFQERPNRASFSPLPQAFQGPEIFFPAVAQTPSWEPWKIHSSGMVYCAQEKVFSAAVERM